MTETSMDKGKGILEHGDKITFNRLVNSLNDFDKGQKEVLNAINRLAAKPRQDQNKLQIT